MQKGEEGRGSSNQRKRREEGKVGRREERGGEKGKTKELMKKMAVKRMRVF